MLAARPRTAPLVGAVGKARRVQFDPWGSRVFAIDAELLTYRAKATTSHSYKPTRRPQGRLPKTDEYKHKALLCSHDNAKRCENTLAAEGVMILLDPGRVPLQMWADTGNDAAAEDKRADAAARACM